MHVAILYSMSCLLFLLPHLNRQACCADQVLAEWKKKTKNDAATRLASVLHAVSTWSQQQLEFLFMFACASFTTCQAMHLLSQNDLKEGVVRNAEWF